MMASIEHPRMDREAGNQIVYGLRVLRIFRMFSRNLR